MGKYVTFIRFLWNKESLAELPSSEECNNVMSETSCHIDFHFFSKILCPYLIFTLAIDLKLSEIYFPSFYSPATYTQEFRISNWMPRPEINTSESVHSRLCGNRSTKRSIPTPQYLICWCSDSEFYWTTSCSWVPKSSLLQSFLTTKALAEGCISTVPGQAWHLATCNMFSLFHLLSHHFTTTNDALMLLILNMKFTLKTLVTVSIPWVLQN